MIQPVHERVDVDANESLGNAFGGVAQAAARLPKQFGELRYLLFECEQLRRAGARDRRNAQPVSRSWPIQPTGVI
jgi:hypothetical protein